MESFIPGLIQRVRPNLLFSELRDKNLERREQAFPECLPWGEVEYGLALAGETGELCNLLKKRLRLAGGSLHDKPGKLTDEEVGKEIADIIIYADLLAHVVGVDLGEAVRAKFNEVSDRRGSTVKL